MNLLDLMEHGAPFQPGRGAPEHTKGRSAKASMPAAPSVIPGHATRPRYPSRPGWKEGDTSRDAAEAVAPSAAILKARVLAALKAQSMTADECAAAIGEPILSVRPRLSELRAEHLIAPTGERRANASGLKAKVWRAA